MRLCLSQIQVQSGGLIVTPFVSSFEGTDCRNARPCRGVKTAGQSGERLHIIKALDFPIIMRDEAIGSGKVRLKGEENFSIATSKESGCQIAWTLELKDFSQSASPRLDGLMD